MAHGKTLELRKLESQHPPIERWKLDDEGNPMTKSPSGRPNRPRRFPDAHKRSAFFVGRKIRRSF